MHTDGWCKERVSPQVERGSPQHPNCPGVVTSYTYLMAPISPHLPMFKATLTSTLTTENTDVCFSPATNNEQWAAVDGVTLVLPPRCGQGGQQRQCP